MRTRLRMAEEAADALVEFRRDDVLKAAGLLVGFGIFDRESVGEQALGKAMAANYVTGTARAGCGEADLVARTISIGARAAVVAGRGKLD